VSGETGDTVVDESGGHVLSRIIPRPFRRFAGYAFLQCWMLVCFSSALLDGAHNLPDITLLHACSSLVSVVTAILLLLVTPRIMPLSRARELGMLASIIGMGGTLCVVLASDRIIPGSLVYAGFCGISFSMTWLGLSWQEYFATQGARAALGGLAITTMMGALLFVVLNLLPQMVAVIISTLLPLATELCLRPQRGTLFFTNIRNPFSAGQLCNDIAHDFSPRLMTVCSLTGIVYAGIRTCVTANPVPDIPLLWLQTAVELASGAVIACIILLLLHQRGLSKVFYLALPCAAVGVVVYAIVPDTGGAIAILLSSTAYMVVQYLVWFIMIERASNRKLPVLGLFTSLWAAGYAGVFVGQMVVQLWPGSYTGLSYLFLLIILAAALLVMDIAKSLIVSKATLEAPGSDDLTRRVLMLADEANLSPRETEILTIWLSGHNAEYLEQVLHISRNTIKTHLSHIYQKTGCNGREELLRRVELMA